MMEVAVTVKLQLLLLISHIESVDLARFQLVGWGPCYNTVIYVDCGPFSYNDRPTKKNAGM